MEHTALRAALAEWCQGDVALARPFVTFADESDPITEEGQEAATAVPEAEAQRSLDGPGIITVEVEVDAWVVLTQTCDIRASPYDRPWVQVAPLVELDESDATLGRKHKLINFAPIPGCGPRMFADLRRVMTIEKPLLVRHERRPGLLSDDERRLFAQHAGRIYRRVAFPDDVSRALKKLQDRLRNQRNKNSPEGRAIRALSEIRVRANPRWTADAIDIDVLFIVYDSESWGTLSEPEWNSQIAAWVDLCEHPLGVVRSISGLLHRLENLTGVDYRYSDPLDLEHLSETGEP